MTGDATPGAAADDRLAAAERAATALATLLADTVQRLCAAGVHDEALGEVKVPRGIGPFKSSPSIAPVGRAWRIGVLLLGADCCLYSVGRVTRATETGRPQGLSMGVEQRRAERQAASRGRFPDGDVVNFDFERVRTDAEALAAPAPGSPLALDGDRVMVRWNSSGDLRPLVAYVDDHLRLAETDD